MKKSKYFLLAVSLLAFLFFACNDHSSNLITDLESQSTQLSASTGDNLVKVVSKDGDGPLVERFVTPVIWDGKSELKSGVVYQWNSVEEMLDAYKDRRPEKYAALKEMFESKENQISGEKKKAEVSPELAWAPVVSATVNHVGSILVANCSIDQPAYSRNPCCLMSHHLVIQLPPNQIIDEIDESYADCQAHYNSL